MRGSWWGWIGYTLSCFVICTLVGDRVEFILNGQPGWENAIKFKNKIVRFIKDQCVSKLSTIELHFLGHLCEDYTNFWIIFQVNPAPHEHFNVFEKAFSKSSMKQAPRMRDTLKGPKVSSEKANVKQRNFNIFVPSASNSSRLQILDVVGLVLYAHGYRRKQKELLRLDLAPTGSWKSQDNLIFKTELRFGSLGAVYKFPETVRELCQELTQYLRYSETLVTFASNGWTYVYKVPALDDFI